MIPSEWFEAARDRIEPYIVRTPLTYDADRRLFLKWENRQVTGSFKARGALNKVLSLAPWERDAGLVAASAGNHGQGVALAASLTDAKAEVFVPDHAVATKVDAIRKMGAELHLVAGGYGEAEAAAQKYAAATGKTFISPYNDGQIIAGQGTLALEVLEQLTDDFNTSSDDIGAWIFPVSGGGLLCGCASALAARGLSATVYGVQPAASAFTYGLFHRGTQEGIRDGPTLADGLSGPIDPESITIPMMREFVADIFSVTERQIESAITFAWQTYGERIEGSAAVAMAAAIDGTIDARPSIVVLTGGNIEPALFEGIIARQGTKSKG
ncbi:MAG TPA: pyridoxal-phosphate dependent enzyme [Anaerolineales bacterium]